MSARRLLAAALLLGAGAVQASDLSRFHDALAQAYAPYRSAVFYLRTGNAMVAGFELEQMRERWSALEARYAAAPPDAYADETDFAATLAAIGHSADTAAEAAAAGDAEAAAAALEPVRGTLAAMRRRAGVRVFSDCVDEVNAAMDALYHYRRTPLDFTDRAQVDDVKARTAVLEYAVQRCDGEAPPEVREDGEFRRLVDGMLAGRETMFRALDREDATAVVNLIRELRSFDRILFLRFG